jgi:hypothetical protein
MLYSVDSMSTRGASGLTLQRHWQMMGALEAFDGMLLFGISTAYIFAVMQVYWPMLSRSAQRDQPAGRQTGLIHVKVVSTGFSVIPPVTTFNGLDSVSSGHRCWIAMEANEAVLLARDKSVLGILYQRKSGPRPPGVSRGAPDCEQGRL